MTTIKLTTYIEASLEDVFNLSRSIDFHLVSAKKTNEKVIAGRSCGLINYNETVTWKAKHFGIYLTHQSMITAFEFPNNFTDEMIRGAFSFFKHQHIFKSYGSKTKMIDIIEYQTPFEVLGKIFDKIVLKRYLTRFINQRNLAIKTHLEAKK